MVVEPMKPGLGITAALQAPSGSGSVMNSYKRSLYMAGAHVALCGGGLEHSRLAELSQEGWEPRGWDSAVAVGQCG